MSPAAVARRVPSTAAPAGFAERSARAQRRYASSLVAYVCKPDGLGGLIDVNKFKPRLSFHQLLDAFGILNAGHLHENPIRTLRAVSLHQRLGDAELVQAAFNDSLRLFRCLFCQHTLRGLRQRPRNCAAADGGRPVSDVNFLSLRRSDCRSALSRPQLRERIGIRRPFQRVHP